MTHWPTPPLIKSEIAPSTSTRIDAPVVCRPIHLAQGFILMEQNEQLSNEARLNVPVNSNYKDKFGRI